MAGKATPEEGQGEQGKPREISFDLMLGDVVAQDEWTNNTNDHLSPLDIPEEWIFRPSNTTALSLMLRGCGTPWRRSRPPLYSPSPMAIDGVPIRLLSVWGAYRIAIDLYGGKSDVL